VILAVLVLVLIVVPVVEIAVIVRIGEWLGLLPTLLLLVADAVLGSIIMRAQGRAAWRRFTLALAERRIPAREVLDGGLVIFGGALMVAPGFLTDIIGALFLAPPTRALVRGALLRRLGRGMLFSAGRLAGRAGARRSPAAPPYDVEGQARDLGSPPPLEPGGHAPPAPSREP
jgi:UPF0716 protein FxsA